MWCYVALSLVWRCAGCGWTRRLWCYAKWLCLGHLLPLYKGLITIEMYAVLWNGSGLWNGECACRCLYSNNTMEWAVCFVFTVMSLWPAAPRMQMQFFHFYTGDQGISQSLSGLLMTQNINVSAMCDSHCSSGSLLGMCVNFLNMPC